MGGSFDPPHNAHLMLATLAREQLALDRVLWVVAGQQPLKNGAHHAPAPDRLRMVELAIGGIAAFTTDARELARTGPSFTVDTLRELRVAHPGAELVLVLGADAAASLARWRDPDGIRELADVAVAARYGEATPDGFLQQVTMPAVEISSSEVRERAAAGRSLAGWVPPAVADYIVARHLYAGRTEAE